MQAEGSTPSVKATTLARSLPCTWLHTPRPGLYLHTRMSWLLVDLRELPPGSRGAAHWCHQAGGRAPSGLGGGGPRKERLTIKNPLS